MNRLTVPDAMFADPQLAGLYDALTPVEDDQLGLVELARERDVDARVRWIEGDARHVDLGDARFKLVVMTFVTRHVLADGSRREPEHPTAAHAGTS